MRAILAAVVGVVITAGGAADQGQGFQAVLTALEPAYAQDTMTWLMMSKFIQQEVKLTDNQKDALNRVPTPESLLGQTRPGAGKTSKGQKGISSKTFDAATKRFFAENLALDQRQRLVQIALQRHGVAHALSEIRETLQLTEAQQAQMAQVRRDNAKDFAWVTNTYGIPPKMRAALQAQRIKDAADKVQAVLTDDQKARWAQLIGPPIDLRLELRPELMASGSALEMYQGELDPLRFQSLLAGGPNRRMEGELRLLNHWPVQEDLKFTNVQRLQLEEKRAELSALRVDFDAKQPPVQAGGDLGPNGFASQMARRREVVGKYTRENGDQLAMKVLTGPQTERFRQIVYQSDGLYTFTRPEVETAIRLTDDQKALAAKLEDELNEPGNRVSNPLIGWMRGREPLSVVDGIAHYKQQQELARRVIALFTAEQKKEWAKLIGAPFAPQP